MKIQNPDKKCLTTTYRAYLITLSMILSLLFLITGCVSTTQNIDVQNDKGKAVMGIDYRDFQQAAALESVLSH